MMQRVQGAYVITIPRGLKNPFWRGVKLAMDKTGAVAALVLFSPLFLFLVLKIRQDGGPAFYAQKRIGKDGREFLCWKFRTMVTDADTVLERLLNADPQARAEWERDRKLRNDPRITRIGHFLRRNSLDELPQFYNVLRGDMSLVGPRPVVEEETHLYGRRLRHYLSVRPGITGLWQVSGRNNLSYSRRVALDSFYVENWSLAGDIAILFRTVFVVLGQRGAY